LIGMMIHQDGSTHEWVLGQKWDLIVTMDDATSEHYSMFFVEEEGTMSSFQAYRKSLRNMDCLLHFTPIVAATTGIHRKQAARLTNRISPSLDKP